MTSPNVLEQLQTLLEYWQRQLRLQDWDITLKVKHAWEVEEGVIAHVLDQPARKEAIVTILDPGERDRPDWNEVDKTPEFDLVHELVHIAIPGPHHGEPGYERYEQGVNVVSKALVFLKRGTPR